jgi:hypothetical protein
MSNEQPIQEQFVKQMNAIADVLQKVFNGDLPISKSKIGFALLCFDMDAAPGARTNYICNCERADMLNAMKEFIARAEGRITDSEALQ